MSVRRWRPSAFAGLTATLSRPLNMTVKGKHVVIVILVLALLMAGGNLLFQWWSGHRAKEYWETEGATLISGSDQVQIWLLQSQQDYVAAGGATIPARTQADAVAVVPPHIGIVEAAYRVIDRRNISRAGGLSHVRRALLRDNLYDWDARPAEEPIRWRYALVFEDGEETCAVFLDERCLLALKNGNRRPLQVRPLDDNTSPLAKFVAEQFEKDADR